MSKIFYFSFFLIIASGLNSDIENELEKIPVIDGRHISWTTLLEEYLKPEKPVILQKAFRDQMAYKIWGHDYFLYHAGAALTFYTVADAVMSLRHMVRNRESFVGLESQMAWFMREDLTIPKFLDCDLLVKVMNRPLFFWEFHSRLVKSHLGNYKHEIWCMVRNWKKMTLISDWTINMVDIEASDFFDDDQRDEAQLLQFRMKEGDCVYLPMKYLRWTEHRADSLAVVFYLDNDLIDGEKHHYDVCQSLGKNNTLNEFFFADDHDGQPGHVVDGEILQLLIKQLRSENTDCIKEQKFLKLFHDDDNPKTVNLKVRDIGSDIFDLIDVDGDGEFCWADIDGLSFHSAKALAKEVSTASNRIVKLYDALGLNNATFRQSRLDDEL